MRATSVNPAAGSPATTSCLALVALVTLLLAWWAWKQGAYFGVVLLPGLIGLCALLGLLLAFAPFPGRVGGPALIALGALLLLAVWTALSALWSPTPYRGPEYAFRVFAYAGLFMLGIWVVLLLRDRMTMALAPVGAGMAIVGVATVVTLWQGSDYSWYLHPDGTLRFPIGYRNANATMLLIAAWPLLSLASIGRLHWSVRSGAVASVTVLASLALLSQSRGSLPALIVGAAVFVLVSPRRLHVLSAALVACLPIALALSPLIDVYRHGSDGPTVGPLLESAAAAIGLAAALAFVAAATAFALVEPRIRLSARRAAQLSRSLGVAFVLAVLAVGAVVVVERGGPIELVESRVDEFRTPAGAPDFTERGVRFGANVQSNRADFWRVALASAGESPLLGQGAGSFEVDYLRERESHESPQDPHSVPLLMVSELGAVGAFLFLVFIAASAVAAIRSRSLGARAALIAAAALAAGAQWLTHASFDWFWQYPGVTAPVMFLLGAASAPRLYDPEAGISRRWRVSGTVAVVAVAVAAAPLFLAERYSNRAAVVVAEDPRRAIEDFERAASLSPLDSRPLVGQAEAGLGIGDVERGRELLEQALEREESNFRARYLLTLVLAAQGDPAAADSYRRAVELNPTDPVLDDVRRAVRQGRR